MGILNETEIKYFLLILHWAHYSLLFYLNFRQYQVCVNMVNVPSQLQTYLDNATYFKCRSYTLDKIRFCFFKDLFNICIITYIINWEFLFHLWNFVSTVVLWQNVVFDSTFWLATLTALSELAYWPFDFYFNFVIEERYGFNQQTPKTYVKDKLKLLLIMEAAYVPAGLIIIFSVTHSGNLFVMWTSFAFGIIFAMLVVVYPIYIATFFESFEEMKPGSLRTDIENLAKRVGYPENRIFIVQGENRTTHSNAYCAGLFHTKRIVLYSSLLNGGHSNKEILAIIAHELGHWKHMHIPMLIVFVELDQLIKCTVFSFFFDSEDLFKAFGFQDLQPVLVRFVIVTKFIMIFYEALVGFLDNILVRYFEYQADNFSSQLVDRSDLVSALMKLYKQNLQFPVDDKWYSLFYNQHPTFLERVAEISKQYIFKSYFRIRKHDILEFVGELAHED